MKRLAIILATLAILFCGVSPLVSQPAYADVCDDVGSDENMKEVLGCKEDKTIGSIGNQWISVVLSFTGLAAVIVIVIGGIFYTKSMGDPGKTRQARNTIIYGVIGLVISLLAYAIVALVVENVSKPGDLGL